MFSASARGSVYEYKKFKQSFKVNIELMDMGKPKYSFRVPLPDGSNLSLAVFATRNDPAAEVISVQVTRLVGDSWVTNARLAVYRSSEGNYSQLPDRQKQ